MYLGIWKVSRNHIRMQLMTNKQKLCRSCRGEVKSRHSVLLARRIPAICNLGPSGGVTSYPLSALEPSLRSSCMCPPTSSTWHRVVGDNFFLSSSTYARLPSSFLDITHQRLSLAVADPIPTSGRVKPSKMPEGNAVAAGAAPAAREEAGGVSQY